MKQPFKLPAYEEIIRKTGISEAAVAYIGDDLPDLPVMRRAGLAVAVGNAVPEVKRRRIIRQERSLATAQYARPLS